MSYDRILAFDLYLWGLLVDWVWLSELCFVSELPLLFYAGGIEFGLTPAAIDEVNVWFLLSYFVVLAWF